VVGLGRYIIVKRRTVWFVDKAKDDSKVLQKLDNIDLKKTLIVKPNIGDINWDRIFFDMTTTYKLCTS